MSLMRGVMWGMVAGAALLAGCDFFSPRTAEKPVNTVGVCRTSRLAPESLFVDLKCSMDARANGEPLYEDLLDEQFLFYMDPQDAVSIGPPNSWTKTTESTFLQSMNSKLDSVRVHFADLQAGGTGQDASLADTAHWVCAYDVFTSPIGSPDSTLFAGTADVTFRRAAGAGTWAVMRWVDHKAGDLRTLGVLRRS